MFGDMQENPCISFLMSTRSKSICVPWLFFRLIASLIDRDWVTRRSLTNVSYYFCPVFSRFRIVLITVVSVRSLVSRTSRSFMSSMNGFPISITLHADSLYLVEDQIHFLVSLSMPGLFDLWSIHHSSYGCRACGFCVRSTAPPSSFTQALFRSRA